MVSFMHLFGQLTADTVEFLLFWAALTISGHFRLGKQLILKLKTIPKCHHIFLRRLLIIEVSNEHALFFENLIPFPHRVTHQTELIRES